MYPTWFCFYLDGLWRRGHTAAAVHGAASVGSSTDPASTDSGEPQIIQIFRVLSVTTLEEKKTPIINKLTMAKSGNSKEKIVWATAYAKNSQIPI